MLKRAGHEAEHLYEIGMLTASDRGIWRYAEEHGAAIVTKDSDFAAMRMHAGSGPAIVWLRFGNIANDALMAALERVLPEIAEAVKEGEQLIEVQ